MATLPVTVTVTDKNGQQVQSVGGSVTPGGAATGSVNLGETTILSADDNGNGNLLSAQPITLSQPLTIQSLSFYVTGTGGQLRLGIYNDVAGKPSQKLAETAAFTPVTGWNTQSTLTHTLLQAGNYWIAYLPQSNSLGFRKLITTTSNHWDIPFTFAVMPVTFPTPRLGDGAHWSLYATFSGGVMPTVWVNSVAPGGTVPPGGGGGLLDNGKSGAPIGGNFQRSASTWWTSYAPQSGQSYGGRRPPYNMAGIDYAIGYASSALPLKTPSAINMPSGASFAAGTITISDAVVTFDGYDFSSPSSVNFNDINNSAGNTVTFRNCNFVANKAGMASWWILAFSQAEIQFINCYIDLGAGTLSDPTNGLIAQFGTSGSAIGGKLTFQYCAILNVIGHFAHHQGLLIQYCYFEGLNFNSGAHGEYTIISNTDTTARTIPLLQWTGSTFLQPATFGGGATAALYMDSGVDGNLWTVTNIQIDHCQFVCNLHVSTGTSMSTAGWATSGSPRVVYTNGPVYTGNYLDGTGAFFRTFDFSSGSQPAATWTGNVDLTTGAAITTYDT